MERSEPFRANPLPDAEERLAALAEAAKSERDILDYPSRAWVPAYSSSEGEEVLNVLVVGGGQAGLAILAHLQRESVDRVMGVDLAEEGAEGPWTTIARMHTLRTPKALSGLDVGLPSLAFSRWYIARYGEAAWAVVDQIPRLLWSAYLAWVRQMLKLPLRNRAAVHSIVPRGPYLAATIRSDKGTETLLARKIVLATGVDGGGGWFVPALVDKLPRRLWAHTSEAIDFDALRGQRVAVLGAGASAMDAAATALEHGACEVRQYCRRAELPTVQFLKWTGFSGFMRYVGDMEDQRRWQFMSFILSQREPFTRDAWLRVVRHDHYRFVLGAGFDRIDGSSERGLRLVSGDRSEQADFVIFGTGVEVAHRHRKELAYFADNIATWADRIADPLPAGMAYLLQFPYLSPGFAYVARRPDAADNLSNIHCFNFAAALSCGPSGASIRGLKFAVPKLVQTIARDLFREDIEHHWRDLLGYHGNEFEPFPSLSSRHIERW